MKFPGTSGEDKQVSVVADTDGSITELRMLFNNGPSEHERDVWNEWKECFGANVVGPTKQVRVRVVYICEVGDVYISRSDRGEDGFPCSVNAGASGHEGCSDVGRHFRVPDLVYDYLYKLWRKRSHGRRTGEIKREILYEKGDVSFSRDTTIETRHKNRGTDTEGGMEACRVRGDITAGGGVEVF
ncbi:hypothetical protein DFS33DRAFT_1278201 [Desarmillaria ectypa]|nr:hypothetical protein DFS33DRAFT_1278201 [Desarmillaria ectypa]